MPLNQTLQKFGAPPQALDSHCPPPGLEGFCPPPGLDSLCPATPPGHWSAQSLDAPPGLDKLSAGETFIESEAGTSVGAGSIKSTNSSEHGEMESESDEPFASRKNPEEMNADAPCFVPGLMPSSDSALKPALLVGLQPASAFARSQRTPLRKNADFFVPLQRTPLGLRQVTEDTALPFGLPYVSSETVDLSWQRWSAAAQLPLQHDQGNHHFVQKRKKKAAKQDNKAM